MAVAVAVAAAGGGGGAERGWAARRLEHQHGLANAIQHAIVHNSNANGKTISMDIAINNATAIKRK
jgi:hypothetical protein